MKSKAFKKTAYLVLVISAGILSYGLGLYQGHKFRASRSVASVEPSNIPSSTEVPKSHSK
jgi:hypothetical protein